MLFHGRRLAKMALHKGLAYTARYAWFNTQFHGGRVGELLVNRCKVFGHPTYLEVEVTTRCNLRCVMCEHTHWQEPERDMTFEQFDRIVQQFPRIDWIGMSGIGTGFLNKDYVRMMRHVKEQRNPYIEIYDSCYMIDAERARELVDLGLDRIIASVDGATEATYEKIRVGAKFKTVIDNVRGIDAARKAAGKKYPEITFHFIASSINKHEMVDFVRLVHSLDLGKETQVAITAILQEFREIEGMAPDITQADVDAVEREARRLGIRVNWNKNVPEKEAVGRCIEWTMPFIFVDGTVIPCCAGNEGNRRDTQRRLSLGNVFETDFAEIWNGPRYRDLREKIWRNEVPAPCRLCSIYRV
jgi:MoaA/NifB/PqqE/SkfB family radical SAM enzyme